MVSYVDGGMMSGEITLSRGGGMMSGETLLLIYRNTFRKSCLSYFYFYLFYSNDNYTFTIRTVPGCILKTKKNFA